MTNLPGRFVLRVAWATLLVLFAAYLAVTVGLGDYGLRLFSTWVYIALGVGAAALLVMRALVAERRAPWLALACSPLLWAAGETIWLTSTRTPDLAPYPSVADALWLSAYFAAGPASCS